nr:DUF3536 domain-containing protein [Bacteroidota bacterium]
TLYNTIKGYSCQDGECSPLIHTATDGEIYGNHEPYGDMCLAALVKKIDNDPVLRLTNYGDILEKNPPLASAILKSGEESKGTSWSCSHGVSRWYKDCGCSTGGEDNWNQEWRTYLRDGFDTLSKSLISIFEKEIAELTAAAPAAILSEYGKVVCGAENPQNFIKKFVKESSSSNIKNRVLTLLEGQKFRHFMYTSCGWFFADISGLEPKQNIKYALHAIKLYAEFTDNNLKKQLEGFLEKAKSNIPLMKNGKVQMRTLLSKFSGIYESAAYFAMSCFLLPDNHLHNSDYGFFKLLDLVKNNGGISTGESNGIIRNFTLTIENTTILKQFSCNVVLFDNIDEEIVIQVFIESESKDTVTIPLQQLPPRMLNSIAKWVNESFKITVEYDQQKISNIMKIFTTSKENLYYSQNNFTQNKKPDSTLLGYCMMFIRYELSLADYCQESQFAHKSKLLLKLLTIISEFGSDQDIKTIKSLIQNFLKRQIDILTTSQDDKCALKLTELLKTISKCGLFIDTTTLQEIVFNLLRDENGNLRKKGRGLVLLAQQLGISLD